MFKTIKSYQLHRHFTCKQSTVQLKKIFGTNLEDWKKKINVSFFPLYTVLCNHHTLRLNTGNVGSALSYNQECKKKNKEHT